MQNTTKTINKQINTIAPMPIISTSELKSVTLMAADWRENMEVDFFVSVEAIRKEMSVVEGPSGRKSNS